MAHLGECSDLRLYASSFRLETIAHLCEFGDKAVDLGYGCVCDAPDDIGDAMRRSVAVRFGLLARRLLPNKLSDLTFDQLRVPTLD